MPIIPQHALNRLIRAFRKMNLEDNFIDLELLLDDDYKQTSQISTNNPFASFDRNSLSDTYIRHETIYTDAEVIPKACKDVIMAPWVSRPILQPNNKLWRLRRALGGSMNSSWQPIPTDIINGEHQAVSIPSYKCLGLRARDRLLNVAGNEHVSADREETIDDLHFVYVGKDYQPQIGNRLAFIVKQKALKGDLEDNYYRIHSFRDYDNIKIIIVRRWLTI